MKKLLFTIVACFAFFGISAQIRNDIDKYTSQKPQYGFIENKGQIHDQNYKANPDVKYLLCLGNGMNVQLKANGFSYDTYKTEVKERIIDDSFDKMRQNDKPRKDITYYFHRVDVELVGANTNPQILAEEPSADYLNYYNAVTPESGATFVRNYRKITYKNIYPGIDMVFVARQGKDNPVEYTFIVHPGADAGLIKLHYIGADNTELRDDKINIDVASGSFTESIPASWIKETNNNLDITYRTLDKDIYCFEIPSYVSTQTLIIDPNPNLDWGTYYGGSGDDQGTDIFCDAGGNVFVTGYTNSTTGIATSGSHQETYAGQTDAFVVKFNSAGVRQWGTYYGGSSDDEGYGISCDTGGNVFITGHTESSTGIATSGAHQDTLAGSDAFVVKFNTIGVRQWSTYYGGNYSEGGYGISCDASGNVFVTGYTWSTTGIATSGAHQETYTDDGISADIYVVKFNTNGVRQWGTYYGGNSHEEGIRITCDASGNVFVTGYTYSTTGIATSGAHQETHADGGCYTGDLFVVKFNSNGVRQWSTYYGGIGGDSGYGISCDASGNVFVTGGTSSTTGIATSGAHQEILAGNSDAFVVKFNSAGVRQWGTYYGGSYSESGDGITCDVNGNVYVTGYTSSTTGIASSGAHQEILAGSGDAFIVKFNSNGVRQWGTYYGGSSQEVVRGISCDASGNICVTGYTSSTTGIASSGAYQVTYGGGYYDAFVARFSTCDIYPANAGLISGPTSVCQYQNSVIFSVPLIANATSYVWTLPSGATGTSDTNSISVDFGLFSGNITVMGTNTCFDGVPSSLPITVSIPDLLDICYVEFDTLTNKNKVFWSSTESNSTDSVFVYREQSLGVWNKIGSTIYSNGGYIDSYSNPMNQSYNYTISAFDTCGFEGELSSNHKTITLIKSYDQLSNTYGFSWSAYEGLSVSEYNVYGVEANGTATIIGTVPGNNYMYNYTNPSPSYLNYFVGFDAPACGAKTNHTVRSNYVSAVTTSIESYYSILSEVYPNPVNEELTIEVKDNTEPITFKILNAIGQEIFNGEIVDKTIVQTSDFASGVYFIRFENGKTVEFKKIVKH